MFHLWYLNHIGMQLLLMNQIETYTLSSKTLFDLCDLYAIMGIAIDSEQFCIFFCNT
jgi:hypothetical protein